MVTVRDTPRSRSTSGFATNSPTPTSLTMPVRIPPSHGAPSASETWMPTVTAMMDPLTPAAARAGAGRSDIDSTRISPNAVKASASTTRSGAPPTAASAAMSAIARASRARSGSRKSAERRPRVMSRDRSAKRLRSTLLANVRSTMNHSSASARR